MAENRVPYVPAYGNITKALQRIQSASTPDRFTQDFLATKLDLKGGSAKPVIPFLKRTGFLASDGTPTALYKRFRNKSQSGAAAAEALRIGYRPLYEINEYVHDVNDDELKGVIVQATGADENSSTPKVILGSFKALKQFADFDAAPSRARGGGDCVGGGSRPRGWSASRYQAWLHDQPSSTSNFRRGGVQRHL